MRTLQRRAHVMFPGRTRTRVCGVSVHARARVCVCVCVCVGMCVDLCVRVLSVCAWMCEDLSVCGLVWMCEADARAHAVEFLLAFLRRVL